jgi:hypothetical protein
MNRDQDRYRFMVIWGAAVAEIQNLKDLPLAG